MYEIVKRTIDLFVAFGMLLFLGPLLMLIALLVKVSSPGPIFFTQERIGLDGRQISISKFRTMAWSADSMVLSRRVHRPDDGPVFRMKSDPRITTVGHILRRMSLDELPMLINVLTGELSLVGPRPAMAFEVARYGPHQRQRLRIKPGLTGYWQVFGRATGRRSLEEMVKMDLEYGERRSLLFDLQILIRSAGMALLGRGAY